MTKEHTRKRLEHLRKELRAEKISYGELSELQSLQHHIDRSDFELLEAAGVPEPIRKRRKCRHICSKDSAYCAKCGKQVKTIYEDGNAFYPPCEKCGSRSSDCGCY